LPRRNTEGDTGRLSADIPPGSVHEVLEEPLAENPSWVKRCSTNVELRWPFN
jgi:hypothetical protein